MQVLKITAQDEHCECKENLHHTQLYTIQN